MIIKLILSNSVGVIDHKYLTVSPDLGGYAAGLAVPADWCLDHGDKISIEFLDRLKEDDELTMEDERVLLASEDGVLRSARAAADRVDGYDRDDLGESADY